MSGEGEQDVRMDILQQFSLKTMKMVSQNKNRCCWYANDKILRSAILLA